MRLLVLALIIPFVNFLLVIWSIRSSSKLLKMWFSQLCIYLINLISRSILIYGVILLTFITAYTITKSFDINLLAQLDVHINLYILAWTISFIQTGINKPVLINKET